MIDSLGCIAVILASICLTVYVVRDGMRKHIRRRLKAMAYEVPCCHEEVGYNRALLEVGDLLITREWVKPMRRKGTI